MSPRPTRQERDFLPRGPKTRRGVELLLTILAVAIVSVAFILAGYGSTGAVPADAPMFAAWFLGLAVVLLAVTRWRAKYADPVIVPIALLINGLGIVMIYRLSLARGAESFGGTGLRQLIWSSLGVVLAIAIVVFLRDHRMLRRITYLSGLAAIVLLLLPLVPGLGVSQLGARIWIRLGPMSFQPGEIAKLLLAVFFAGYFVAFRDGMSMAGPKFLGIRWPRLRDFGPIAIMWVLSLGILIFQRDLGSSVLFFGLFVAMLYVATERRSWLIIGLGMTAVGITLAGMYFSHVQRRVDGWLHTFDRDVYERTGGSHQLAQGLFGLAEGGLTGTGLGRGRPFMVPFADSDFIISSLGEELGLIGLFAILALYLVFIERGFRVATAVRDDFGKLLTSGLIFAFALQIFVVVGGVTRVIPLTGLTTPFLAAGGSSVIANWLIVGLLLRVSDNARRPQAEFETGVLRVVRGPDDPAAERDDEPRGAAAGVVPVPDSVRTIDRGGRP